MGTRQAETLFNEFASWGFDVRGWSAKTRREYVYKARRADAYLRAHTPRSVFSASAKDLQRYLFSLKPTATTRNLARQALVGFYDFLVWKEWRDDNPAQGLPILPLPEKLPKAIPAEQITAVLKASRAFGPMVECLVNTYGYTGLRRDEVRCLGWHEWNQGEAVLDLFIGKQRKQRRVPLHANAQDALSRWRAKSDNAEIVFPSPRNPRRPISDTWVETTIRAVGDMAGVEGLHPHIFRHSLASHLIDIGWNLKVVQEVLGHSTIAATERYLKLRPPRVAEAMTTHDWTPKD